MSTTHPIENTTEWDELQIKYGNYPERPKPITNEVLTNLAIDFAEGTDILDKKSLKELEKFEDELEEEVLEVYKKKRIQELKELKQSYKYGAVIDVGKTDYIKEVTEASKECHVILLLYTNTQPICQLLIRSFHNVAKRHGHLKFCKGIVNDIIPNYPEQKLPTVLIYKNGHCEMQICGGSIWGGHQTNDKCVEWVLYKKGILKTSICEDDPRTNQKKSSIKNQMINYNDHEIDHESSDDESEKEERNADRRGYSSLKLEERLHLK